METSEIGRPVFQARNVVKYNVQKKSFFSFPQLFHPSLETPQLGGPAIRPGGLLPVSSSQCVQDRLRTAQRPSHTRPPLRLLCGERRFLPLPFLMSLFSNPIPFCRARHQVRRRPLSRALLNALCSRSLVPIK